MLRKDIAEDQRRYTFTETTLVTVTKNDGMIFLRERTKKTRRKKRLKKGKRFKRSKRKTKTRRRNNKNSARERRTARRRQKRVTNGKAETAVGTIEANIK